MKRHFRSLAIAFSLLGAASAFAQQPPDNPAGRTGDVFSMGSAMRTQDSIINGQGVGGSALSQDIMSNIQRAQAARPGAQVTPVPEPSQWALMAAGLVLVGVAVRRSRRKG